jgi:hypothetical protein
MSRSILALGGVLGALVLATPVTLRAADLSVQEGASQARNPTTVYCGTCGCLQVAYVHHRELRSTYGLAFDPRNDDQTEPQYYFGRVRAYPRYFVDDVPVPDSCD